ncbi:MAG TPA: dihydrolipoamide acetyltransferase family protein [Gaiellaceae bacterium]|nr:dihydrolipoamide acetyltransferase family protein [Gaiellaceae bacterium]
MANEVKLPRLGQGMESGTIVKWLKAEGDQVEKGEPLYELDTDKVTQEVEAEASGVLLKITVPEGEADVGTTIAVIGEQGEEVPDLAPAGPAAKEPQPVAEEPQAPAQTAPAPVEVAAPSEGNGAGARIKASPLARRIARERGIELGSLKGTGPEGRVVAEDVERAASGAPTAPAPAPASAPLAPPGEIERVPLTSIRRTIARRLTEAWQAPVFQIAMSADMTRAQSLHDRLAEQTKEGEPRPTVTDILTKACAAALMRHRAVNALWADDAIDFYPSANVGIAVAIEAGLVVPVIHQAERKTIAELAAARADIVTRARDNKLRQEDVDGGTFTISNLGMYGVDQFVAVLNPPQAAILAVGAIEPKAVPTETGIEARPLMAMTLTCDHRALDGATAADFLRTVKAFLEEPGLML